MHTILNLSFSERLKILKSFDFKHNLLKDTDSYNWKCILYVTLDSIFKCWDFVGKDFCSRNLCWKSEIFDRRHFLRIFVEGKTYFQFPSLKPGNILSTSSSFHGSSVNDVRILVKITYSSKKRYNVGKKDVKNDSKLCDVIYG